MKTGRTLQELAVELQRQNAAKRDFIVGSAAMEMDSAAFGFHLHGGQGESEAFSMTDLFHRQMGGVLGIPAKYYDKMRLDFPELLAGNVNGWLGRGDSRHTIRTLDGSARAFLSDRYRRIDNYEIAEAVLPVIGQMDGARIESCEVTENRMYLKVVNTRLEMEVVPGDIVQAGIIISNSEVGLGAVSVMPLIYRLVCANGMIVTDFGKRKYHVGRENEEAWELFSDTTLQADDQAFMLKLADIVRSAVDESRFGVIVDKLREATETKMTAPVASVVELTGKQYGFNTTESDSILQHLILGGDLSLCGLANAVTRSANDMDSYERATELEAAGWQIATMENRVWKELNEVAV
jgi:hypothetical protein